MNSQTTAKNITDTANTVEQEKKEKILNIISQHVDDNHRTCTTCLNEKRADEFIENDKHFKQCNSCRNKPKQNLIALKEALAGGSTKTCKICQLEKQVNQFQRNRETNAMVSNCNPCRKMLFEKFTI